jgi:hypothetical protein
VTANARSPKTRRDVLRAAALALLAAPLAAACGPGYAESPDPLTPLLTQAEDDANAARSLATGSAEYADLARQVAAARTAHADALRSEVERLNRPRGQAGATAPRSGGLDGLKERLAHARGQAERLVPGLPAYRAGLVASVAAGCAGLQRLAPGLGPGEDPAQVEAPAGGPADPASLDAVQQVLATEHAAIWVYGLVSAFLPGDYTAGATQGAAEHVQRRDACERVLAAGGVTPRAAEPAYIPPEPVTDARSAMVVVATAEADTMAAWRGLLDRTDDGGLRTMALRALTASARRGTRWRAEGGQTPAALPLPGQSA